MADVWANSGEASDIQTAINSIASAGGTVNIPDGNHYFSIKRDGFIGVANQRTGIQIPGGVNLKGLGQGLCTLNIPIDAWDSVNHGTYTKNIAITLNGSNNKTSKLSGFTLKGSIDFSQGPTTDTYAQLGGVITVGARDFNIGQISFVDFDDYAVLNSNNWSYNPQGNCGVIHHCDIDNPYKNTYLTQTGGPPLWAYGIIPMGYGYPTFNADYTQFFGKYGPNIIFIEDCTFARCRHMVAGGSQSNAYYVLRHSIMNDMILAGYGSYQDLHGGGLGCEVYNNSVINTAVDSRSEQPPESDFGKYDGIGFYSRGGFGLYYNNTYKNLNNGSMIVLANDQTNSAYRLNKVWLWNNQIDPTGVTGPNGTLLGLAPNSFEIRENIEYFMRAPNQAQDGWTYTAYPYPHPLVGAIPTQGTVSVNSTVPNIGFNLQKMS